MSSRDAVDLFGAAPWTVVVGNRCPRRLLRGHRRAPVEERDHFGLWKRRVAPTGMGRAEDERLNPCRVTKRNLLGDHAAEREPVEMDVVDLEVVEDRDGVVRHRLGGVGVSQRLRLSDPAMVEGDHPHRTGERVDRTPPGAPA